jgi:hypothetical protein
MGYLALLDQIGTAVRDLSPRRISSGNSGVERSLALFSEKADDEAICLYALRNSLAHNFSLVNVPPHSAGGKVRRRKLTRHFTLTRGSSELITWPVKDWSTRRPNQPDSTTVDVKILGDVVEEVVREMRQRYAAGKLRIRTTGITPATWRMGRFLSFYV